MPSQKETPIHLSLNERLQTGTENVTTHSRKKDDDFLLVVFVGPSLSYCGRVSLSGFNTQLGWNFVPTP